MDEAMKTKQIKQDGVNAFRVLVVEDNEADRCLAMAMLVDAWPFAHDLVMDCANDGADTLKKLRTHRFDLVVLDWMLPTIGGAQVLRAIRQDGHPLPVVVLSGLQREQIDEDLVTLGAAFLHKDQMSAESFCEAISTSLSLMGRSNPLPKKL